jgi:segregation and condensation protein A
LRSVFQRPAKVEAVPVAEPVAEARRLEPVSPVEEVKASHKPEPVAVEPVQEPVEDKVEEPEPLPEPAPVEQLIEEVKPVFDEPVALVEELPPTTEVVQELEAVPQEAVVVDAAEVKEPEPEPQPEAEPEAALAPVPVAAEVEELKVESDPEPEPEIMERREEPESEPALVSEEPEPVEEVQIVEEIVEEEKIPEPEIEPEPEEIEVVTEEPEEEKVEETVVVPSAEEIEEAVVELEQQEEIIEVEAAEEAAEIEVSESAPLEEMKEEFEPKAELVTDVQETEVVEAPVAPETLSVPMPEAAVEVEPEVAPEPAPALPHAAAPVNAPIKHTIKPDDDKNSPFSILVGQVYEGPMDLLLDLIRKQDIDIYDIPIAKITEQFLFYVEHMRASEMDIAGEFIYTASLLIHIKSKMLLPRAPAGPEDLLDDPRRELVERLLEHERFKNAAQMLQQKQMIEAATWSNPGMREFKGDEGTEPELAADTVDLARVFQEILDRFKNRPIINVEEDQVTVGQMIQFLGRRLNMEDKPIALRKLLAHTHSRRSLVAMFLALLELVRLQAILLRQDRLFSEIFIKKHADFDSVMTEGFMAARDDWG